MPLINDPYWSSLDGPRKARIALGFLASMAVAFAVIFGFCALLSSDDDDTTTPISDVPAADCTDYGTGGEVEHCDEATTGPGGGGVECLEVSGVRKCYETDEDGVAVREVPP